MEKRELEKDEKPGEDLVGAGGVNKFKLYCRVCGCVILSEGVGTYVETPIFLHYDKQSAQSKAAACIEADRANNTDNTTITTADNTNETSGENKVVDVRVEGVSGQTYNHFWQIKKMFDFENIAFTKSLQLDKHRYLTCADCEIQIVGINYLPGSDVNPNTFFVSVNKVAYKKPDLPKEVVEQQEKQQNMLLQQFLLQQQMQQQQPQETQQEEKKEE